MRDAGLRPMAASDVSALAAATEQQLMLDRYRADAEAFEHVNPDFKEAYNFFMNSRAAELKAIGYDEPQALHQALIAEEEVIVRMAFQSSKSPAEVLYKLAHQRGYDVEKTKAEIPRFSVAGSRRPRGGARSRCNIH